MDYNCSELSSCNVKSLMSWPSVDTKLKYGLQLNTISGIINKKSEESWKLKAWKMLEFNHE